MNASRPGEAMIADLLTAPAGGRASLERCTANPDVTAHHRTAAHRRLASGTLVAGQFPEDAVAAAHDAIQRIFSAYLNEEGLRPTSAEGKHAAIIDAVESQLFYSHHALRAQIRSLKAQRNLGQYGTETTGLTETDALEALHFAQTVVTYVETLIDRGVQLWLA